MKFTTLVPIPNSIHPLDYDSLILSLGSCFAVNMGEKLDYFKFQNTTNPFGIIFNPISIERLIVRAVNQKKFTEEDKPMLTCYISKELVASKNLNAGLVVRELGKHIQGGGGGQPFFATAGGKNTAGIAEALEKAVDFIK